MMEFSRGVRGSMEAAFSTGVLASRSTIFSPNKISGAKEQYEDFWKKTLDSRDAVNAQNKLDADIEAAARRNRARMLLRQRAQRRAERQAQLAEDQAASAMGEDAMLAMKGRLNAKGSKRLAMAGLQAARLMGTDTAVGSAAGVGLSAFYGVQEAARALGSSMLQAGGIVAVFGASLYSVTKAVSEYNRMVKAQKQAEESGKAADAVENATTKAFSDFLSKMRSQGKISDDDYVRLIGFQGMKGSREQRNAAIAEIRKRFGGQASVEEMKAMERANRAESEPDEKKRKKLLEGIRYEAELAKAAEVLGDWAKASDAQKAANKALVASIHAKHKANVAEIERDSLPEKISSSSKPASDSLVSVGNFLGSSMRDLIADQALRVARDQLSVLRSIDGKMKPGTGATGFPA